jgi:hypothetical protein
VYSYLSHAYHIVGRFLDGFPVYDGRTGPEALHRPPFDVVSLFIEQVSPATDLGRAKAKGHQVRLSPTIADALTLGTHKLAVDAVLLIAEHGEYPYNEKLQKLYPRGKYFREVLEVFRASGRAVPVFIDKHLSYSRVEAEAMIKAAAAQQAPLMAGSSLPVTWRLPPLEIPLGRRFHEVLVASRGDLEIFGFHALETLRCISPRRRGPASSTRWCCGSRTSSGPGSRHIRSSGPSSLAASSTSHSRAASAATGGTRRPSWPRSTTRPRPTRGSSGAR